MDTRAGECVWEVLEVHGGHGVGCGEGFGGVVWGIGEEVLRVDEGLPLAYCERTKS